MITKPMLAGKAPADLADLTYPGLVTPKLDGIRCLIINGQVLSRTFKPIPNDHIRESLEAAVGTGVLPDGLDGELTVRGRDFNELSGDIRRQDGEPDFIYHVFDYVEGDGLNNPYEGRMEALEGWPLPFFCEKVLPHEVTDVKELTDYEELQLARGYEGVMWRKPDGGYKCGRSSTKEELLLKIKRFEDAEAIVIGTEEEMENTNEATKDAFGRTERSTHKENMIPKGRMGKLVVKWRGKEHITFEIGTGFTADMRQKFWDRRGELVGRLVKFKYQAAGMKEGGRPRIPVFLGWRDAWDISV